MLPQLVMLGAIGVIGITVGSYNELLWAAGGLVLVAAVLVLGKCRSTPVFIWIIGISWISIVGDILLSDVRGVSVADGFAGQYAVEAILLSLAALVVLALGINLGSRQARRWFRIVTTSHYAEEKIPRIDRIALLYFGCYIVAYTTGLIVSYVPALQQQLYALSFIKFVCIYLMASVVFISGRGYAWLILILVLEIITGAISYFAAYKEAIYVMLIALFTHRLKHQERVLLLSGVAISCAIWYSLVWTAIKPKYRANIYALPAIERLSWIWSQIDTVDYVDAAEKLIARVGYTSFYAKALANLDYNNIELPKFYSGAIWHVLTPRILFPDKAAINDSVVTTLLTGLEFTEGTSVSIGYVAEAHVDFGVPLMFVPILLIGMGLGLAQGYFIARSAPLLIRQAFATACLFSSFIYGQNIDKAVGGFLMVVIVLGVALKFGYPRIAEWLYRNPQPRGALPVGRVPQVRYVRPRSEAHRRPP